MCIDVCPVGALTSGSYRYKTRPWEMNHVSTVCTHCADGCKVTLGVRQANDGSEIVRADNRDKSGINSDFLCAKGRFGFDFVESPERLTKPLVRNAARQTRTRHLGARASPCRRQAERDSRQHAAAQPSASSAPTAPPTKRIICCRNSRARCSGPTTSTTSAAPITQPLPALSPDTTAKPPACATSLCAAPSCSSAAIPRRSIRFSPGSCAPTCASIARASTSPTPSPSSSTARPRPRSNFAAATKHLAAFLDHGDIRIQQGCSRRGIARRHLRRRVSWRGRRESRCLGPQARQRPIRLPRRPLELPRRSRHGPASPISSRLYSGHRPRRIREYPNLPLRPAKRCRKCSMRPAKANSARCSSSAPIRFRSAQNRSRRAQEHIRHRAGSLPHRNRGSGRRCLPAASLYEKSGTVTNTYGDVQMVRKAADRAGVKPDFEILVRLAGAMGATSGLWFPSAKAAHSRSRPVTRRAGRRSRSPRRLA